MQTAPRSRDPFPNPPVDVIGTTDTWRPHASPTCNIGYRLDKSNPSVTDCDRCHTTSNLHPLVYVLRCHQAQSLSTCQGSFLAVTQGKFRPIKATKKRGARASERANERGAIMTPAESCPSSLSPPPPRRPWHSLKITFQQGRPSSLPSSLLARCTHIQADLSSVSPRPFRCISHAAPTQSPTVSATPHTGFSHCLFTSDG